MFRVLSSELAEANGERDNAAGKIVGRILLVIVSFVVGVVVGLCVAIGLGRLGHAWHLEWLTHPLVRVVCAIVGGLLFVVCGRRTSHAFEKREVSWHDK